MNHLANIAARQEGTFSLDQASSAGFTRAMIRTQLRDGSWRREHAGVFALTGSPRTWRQRLFAASLAAGEGAVISHLAAARLHGLVSATPGPELTIPRPRRVRVEGITVHRATELHPVDVVEADGLAVTSPTKTAIDLCRILDLDALVDVFDHLFTTRMSMPHYVRRRAAAYSSTPRLLTQLLERYPNDERAPESKEERRLVRLLSTLPGTLPVPQHPLRLLTGEEIRVDVGYPCSRVAVELQSYRFHAGSGAFALDASRATELAAVGWTWVPITPWDVRYRPMWVLDRVGRIKDGSQMVARRLFVTQL